MPIAPVSQLKRTVRDGLAYLRTQPDVAEAEVSPRPTGTSP